MPTHGKVCMDVKSHIGKGWKSAIGKPLTDRMISKYIKAGRYGDDMKLRTEQREKVKKIPKKFKSILEFI